ncbi:MAG: PEP-CTERM sorting domain-containing protein [Phycisphaerales bacterium]|nr:PEP-CTERM sorting domain-containing protein [Phycisphaerales bacterium]|tara:strand:- start:1017 stop:1676 length:660 start_codon:yes stop_codon:yes gene_type:complete
MNKFVTLSAVVAVSSCCLPAGASVVYEDSTGDLFDNSMSHLDITSATVSHDAANVNILVEFAGSISDTDWGNYIIAFDAYEGGTDSNAWNRNIDFGDTQIDRFIGSWVNSGGGIDGHHHFNGWYGNNDGLSITLSDTGIMYTISREWLGNDVDSFGFDVMSSGTSGDNPGVDHLSQSASATDGWGSGSTSGTFLTYNLPAPGALALLGIAGLARSRRRR